MTKEEIIKYCAHCGNQLLDEAVVCPKCGCATGYKAASQNQKILFTIIKIFMIIGCVAVGSTIIGLAWTIPMTVSVFRCLDNRERIGIGFKVCTLLFCNLVAGIILLVCDTENYSD